MESIDKILKFLKIDNDINNFNSGYGSGTGSGSFSGTGDGSGYGDGYSSGYGSGDGTGYSSVSGTGFGYGSGAGLGSFFNNDLGIKIIKLDNDFVFYVDGIPTIFEKIHNDIAKCEIVDWRDFSKKSCYVVKNECYFAHGETVREAFQELQDKVFANMDIGERINEFIKVFNKKDKYRGEDFYNWHHILTGSCKMGRKQFFEVNGYSFDDLFTVKEFIKICENAYGREVIKRLEEYYR